MMETSKVTVCIFNGPLEAAGPWGVVGAGALLCFEGVVRPTEDGRALVALDYETYEPMAQQQLEALGRDIVERHGLLALQAEHSRGRVPVGLIAFRLSVACPHRQEGLAAMQEFIDRMKRDVPIWKTPVFDECDDTDRQSPTRQRGGVHSP